MYELSVAFKYLIPRWRQLSVSVISLISIVVIALVVWLTVVFFSVTNGLESAWVQKLIALTAPIRISPTSNYFTSYYYLSDSISQSSDYTLKSIGEKLSSPASDPYNPHVDQEIPFHWPQPERNSDGTLKDPVKEAFAAIQNIQELTASEYEMTVTNLKLSLIRSANGSGSFDQNPGKEPQSPAISQATYIGSYDSSNLNLAQAMLSVTKEDVHNLIHMMELDGEGFGKLFNALNVQTLITSDVGVAVPIHFFPESCSLQVLAFKADQSVASVLIPKDLQRVEMLKKRPWNEKVKALRATLEVSKGAATLFTEEKENISLPENTRIVLDANIPIHGKPTSDSLARATTLAQILINATIALQGETLRGELPWNGLQVDTFAIAESKKTPFFLFQDSLPESLPPDSHDSDAVLLPKSYRTSGVLLGDRGFLSYQTPTAAAIQEQRIPVYVAGFYDPGILPLGGKIILANQDVTAMIRSSYPDDHSSLSNGISVRFDDLGRTEQFRDVLKTAFIKAGIDKYWKIETYKEFEFTKDFLQQLRSEKNLFTIISTMIIIVACANIVSMLIILVNNKKMEIGILRSMGATSKSIAFIFGSCGVIMGFVGSMIGMSAAWLTLRHLQSLIDLISRLQGFDAFNPVFYGDSLPNKISVEALLFVTAATVVLSLIAGIIPALKASFIRPSAILRSE